MVCQLVDCRFCKHKRTSEWVPVCTGHGRTRPPASPHLEMIRIIFIVQVEPLLKGGDGISDEQVSDVLGQQLVDACVHKSRVQLPQTHLPSARAVFPRVPAPSSCA